MPWDSTNSWKAFSASCWLRKCFACKKLLRTWRMRQNFVAQFVQLVKPWLCDMQSDVVVEKNWALSVEQCWLQSLQFSVHLIDLLSILLRCNAYSGIQKAVMDLTSSRSPNNDHDHIWCKFGYVKCFGASTWLNHWPGHRQLSYRIHFSLYVTIWSRNGSLSLRRIREDDTSKLWSFLSLVSSWGTHLSSFFTFPICFQCRRTVEWLTLSSWVASCVVVRGSVNDTLSWLLSSCNAQALCSPISRLSSPLQNFLTTTAMYVR